jgi:predicted HAD superfamily Cof-like phosphohydrolase
VHALDALCDREVTGNGVAFLLGFNKPAADEAVLRSNEAKLVNGEPVILEGGKIGKPEGWQPPDLKPFV